MNARVLPNRNAILPLLPKGKIIAEIGVAFGDFSQTLIECCAPRTFIAVDIFTLHELETLWGRPARDTFGDRSHLDFYLARFADLVRQGVVQVIHKDSVSALEQLDDQSVDIFYVDANHTYESVSKELSTIKNKIAPDGYIILNDYIMNEVGFSNAPYGVAQATNEFMIENDWEMMYFALHEYMYCDVVLRKFGVADTQPAQQRITALEQENARLRRDIDLIRASTSWRVSSPIRALRQLLPRRP
jgi:hypothetical protein